MGGYIKKKRSAKNIFFDRCKTLETAMIQKSSVLILKHTIVCFSKNSTVLDGLNKLAVVVYQIWFKIIVEIIRQHLQLVRHLNLYMRYPELTFVNQK